MPVPTLITDLSQTESSNGPDGTVDSPNVLDGYQRALGAFIAQLRDGKGHANPVTLASATSTDIGGQNSQFVEISGTTTITGFGTSYNGPRFLRFTGALTLTHSASLALPGDANIVTAAGDTAIAIPNLAANGWRVVEFKRASNMIISAVNATTYDVSALSHTAGWLYLTNATTRTITNFTGAVNGQILIVMNDSAGVVTINQSNAYLDGAASQVLASFDTIMLAKYGSYWYQVAPKSSNG